MPSNKPKLQIVPRKPAAASSPPQTSPPEAVSARWLAAAVATVLAAAGLCAWGVLCLLFWQGSWQLLYHPTASVARTPAAAGLSYSAVAFAVDGSGAARLNGWWIPAPQGASLGRYSVLYFHGQDGNLGDTVDQLAQFHSAGVNVFAFDYRGYGQSVFAHPGEKGWLEDAGWALDYLAETRHVDPRTIVLAGSALGANLALQFAAAHPQLAGVALVSPLNEPVEAVFRDARASLVPGRLLVRDRFDLNAPATELRIPSLWLLPASNDNQPRVAAKAEAFQKVPGRKTLVWLTPSSGANDALAHSFSSWLKSLS
jgi:pimeloyl-ACP methyl ester carboxylesterase